MFIPSEAVLSAALEVDASLLEYALANGVLLTTPISLLAVARTVADAWMQMLLMTTPVSYWLSAPPCISAWVRWLAIWMI